MLYTYLDINHDTFLPEFQKLHYAYMQTLKEMPYRKYYVSI
jgi:hypothetical protein